MVAAELLVHGDAFQDCLASLSWTSHANGCAAGNHYKEAVKEALAIPRTRPLGQRECSVTRKEH
jgi:hypothetical protein